MGRTIDQLMADDIAEDLLQRIRDEIDKDDLVFTGQLKDSFRVVHDDLGRPYVASPLIYARVMDEGRLPGKMPPVSALFPWVATRLGGSDPGKIRQKAFAVAKSIAENGIEGRHYLSRALFAMESESR
jgi:hypothetical protein